MRFVGTSLIALLLCARVAFAFGPSSGSGGTPGGSSGQIQYNNNGVLGGITIGGTLGSHNFANALSSSGVLSGAQPACSDLSNAAGSCSTDATNAANIGSGTLNNSRLNVIGFAPSCTTLAGATPTLTPANTATPVKECFVETLSANTTLTSFASGAAPTGMWTAHVVLTQPSGAHNYTLAFSAGSGEAIVYPNAGGCSSLPTMPTGTGHSLTLDLLYNTLPASPEIDVLSCPTTGS